METTKRMKALGIVRRVDELGRVVLPKELRVAYRMREGDPVEIYGNGEGLMLRRYEREKEAKEILDELKCYIELNFDEGYAEKLNPLLAKVAQIFKEMEKTEDC